MIDVVFLFREHVEDGQQPRQSAVQDTHDHTRSRERYQTLAPSQKPRPSRPARGRSREQDGVRDLPDTTAGHQGELAWRFLS